MQSKTSVALLVSIAQSIQPWLRQVVWPAILKSLVVE
jgi:hypothetical protein